MSLHYTHLPKAYYIKYVCRADMGVFRMSLQPPGRLYVENGALHLRLNVAGEETMAFGFGGRAWCNFGYSCFNGAEIIITTLLS